MKNSDDALLYAAATIVAAQINAKTFNVDMSAEVNVASALAEALNGVASGVKKWEDDKARDAAAKRGPGLDISKLAVDLRAKARK